MIRTVYQAFLSSAVYGSLSAQLPCRTAIACCAEALHQHGIGWGIASTASWHVAWHTGAYVHFAEQLNLCRTSYVQARAQPKTHAQTVEYFLNTEAGEMEYETAKCRPLLDEAFFKHLDAEIGGYLNSARACMGAHPGMPLRDTQQGRFNG